MTDTYEGWSNRETWSAQLWMTNEEGIYNDVSETALLVLSGQLADIAPEDGDTIGDALGAARYELSQYIEGMWDEWHAQVLDGEAGQGVRGMVLDVGSLYRVDWCEIAEHWITDAMSELETEQRENAR